tara:strand:+ start:1066 stop:1521 length:456 start_codon:yes stop_codon:yes gene_type:complete
MKNPIIINHANGAPGLRFFGIGPNFKPSKGIQKLADLLNNNTSWATDRSPQEIKTMLKHSSVVVSVWGNNQLIGFGRATSDEVYRSVLWDIVVDRKYQHNGLGKKIVQAILHNPKISRVEKVYIMTTNCQAFYNNMRFKIEEDQNLMILKR